MELYNRQCIKYYNIGNRRGHTDYIDFLKWGEITEPVMKGIDICNRHFVVVKLKIYDSKNKKNKHINIKLMQTYFQRYTNGILWMGCGYATESFLETCGGMNLHQLDLIEQIINNNSVEIRDEHRPSSSDYIGKTVELYDEEKEKAAVTIQKHWLRCRYNPNYKMCKKLQLQDYYEIMSSKSILE